jgi:hypothetical protein
MATKLPLIELTYSLEMEKDKELGRRKTVVFFRKWKMSDEKSGMMGISRFRVSVDVRPFSVVHSVKIPVIFYFTCGVDTLPWNNRSGTPSR